MAKPNRDNERFFLELAKSDKLRVDTENGFVYSNLVGQRNRKITAKSTLGYITIYGDADPTTRQCKKRMMVHRLIWIWANGEIPDGLEINHRNGDKEDNRLSNLELVTRRENIIHARKVLGKIIGVWGKDHSGENAGNSKLTWELVDRIRDIYSTKEHTMQQLSDEFGVKPSTIHRIVHFLSWNKRL